MQNYLSHSDHSATFENIKNLVTKDRTNRKVLNEQIHTLIITKALNEL